MKRELGNYTLANITPEVITRCRDKLQTEKGLSSGSINRYLALLSKAYSNTIKE